MKQKIVPIALDLSHKILRELAEMRRESDEIKYLNPILNHKLPWNTQKINPLKFVQLLFQLNMMILIMSIICSVRLKRYN